MREFQKIYVPHELFEWHCRLIFCFCSNTLGLVSLILLICSFSALAQTESSPRLAVENNLLGSATPEGAIKEPQEQQKAFPEPFPEAWLARME